MNRVVRLVEASVSTIWNEEYEQIIDINIKWTFISVVLRLFSFVIVEISRKTAVMQLRETLSTFAHKA